MDCRYFDDCSAPLCPKGDTENTTWFPDEDICRMADAPAWVKRQRKISRMGLSFEAGYFTHAMMEHPCRLTRGMKGIDPDGTDKERAADEAVWFKAHPVITAEQREKLRARVLQNKAQLAKARASKSGFPPCADALSDEKGIQVPPTDRPAPKGKIIPFPGVTLAPEPEPEAPPPEPTRPDFSEVFDSLGKQGLSSLVITKAVYALGAYNLDQIAALSTGEIAMKRGMGPKTVGKLRAFLQSKGLDLKE
jgi:hypothetical protein